MKTSSRTKISVVTPNDIQPVTIRYARVDDLAGVKIVADRHRTELGFIRTSVFHEAQRKGWLLIAVRDEQVIGFANFRIRQDNNATLYDIVVDGLYRKQKIGKRLVQRLTWLVNVAGGEHIRLKCPQSLPANAFYEKLQFTCTGTETGKKRPLNVWHYFLPSLPRAFEFYENGSSFFYKVPEHSPHFFASATIAPGEIRKIYQLWHTHAHDFHWPPRQTQSFSTVVNFTCTCESLNACICA